MSEATSFFNRSHLIQGAQALATVFGMLGTIFIGLDRLGAGRVSPSTLVWIGMSVILSGVAVVASRRLRSGAAPFATGVVLGLLYLGVGWFLARTGG